MKQPPPSVCMVARSDYFNDPRVRREAETLAADGFSVRFIALSTTPRPPRAVDGVPVRWIREFPIPRWRSWRLRRLCFRFLYFFYRIRALLLCLSRKTDIYHANDLDTLWVCAAAARLRRARLVYDSHELFLECSPNIRKSDWEPLERRLIRAADAVLTVNRPIAEELSRRYGVPLPHLIHNYPPLASAVPSGYLREKAGLSPNSKIILFIGGLLIDRGLEQLVSAVKHLPAHAVLVFLGWGPLENSLRSQAAGAGLESRVRFLEKVPIADVLSCSASADIGVIPYRNTCLNNYYCLPNKAFDYMMAGIPLAVSDFPVVGALVKQHDCGMTFDPESPESIADTLNAMLADEARLRAMGRNGRAAAENELNWQMESRKFLAVYRSLAS